MVVAMATKVLAAEDVTTEGGDPWRGRQPPRFAREGRDDWTLVSTASLATGIIAVDDTSAGCRYSPDRLSIRFMLFGPAGDTIHCINLQSI